MTIYKMKNGCRTAFLILLCVLTLTNMSLASAEGEQMPEINTDTSGALLMAYKMIRGCGTIFAVVGIAGNGLGLMIGNSSNAEKSYRRILYILIAVACLWIIPGAVSLGRSVFGSGWNPARVN